MRSGATKPEAQAAVRPHEVVDRVLEVDVELKVVVRQSYSGSRLGCTQSGMPKPSEDILDGDLS